MALRVRAAEREQLLGVRQRFDAFGDEPHAELVRQFHDGAADGAAVVGRSHARDERPIQLERVDRVALQRAQRRIAGAEVVEVDRHVDVTKTFEIAVHDVGGIEERVLGNLEAQRSRQQPADLERTLHFVHEVAAGEKPRRDVHRNTERLAEHPLPGGRLAACVAEHRIGERHDEPGLLGHRDEIGRADHPTAGTGPAHERLEAADVRRGQLDDRLVDEREVVALDRLAQLGLERQALDRRGVHVRVEDLIAAAAGRLGAIHRDVGVAQQFVHGGVWRAAEHDADTRRRVDLVAVQADRIAERPLQALGDEAHLVGRGETLDQHRELVAAEA